MFASEQMCLHHANTEVSIWNTKLGFTGNLATTDGERNDKLWEIILFEAPFLHAILKILTWRSRPQEFSSMASSFKSKLN